MLIFWLAVLIGVISEAALVYSPVRLQRLWQSAAPEWAAGWLPLELAWAVGPALLLLLLIVATAQTIYCPPAETLRQATLPLRVTNAREPGSAGAAPSVQPILSHPSARPKVQSLSCVQERSSVVGGQP